MSQAYYTLPYNAATGKAYEGRNADKLSLKKFKDPRWMTFRQAISLGYIVKKGEKATRIVFVDPKAINKEGKKCKVYKGYSVFNIQQCEKMAEDHPYKICVVQENFPQLSEGEST